MSTVVFFPEGAFGPTNNCVGIGRVLLERGDRVVFVVEESFAGTLEAQGFEEALMRLKPPPEVEEAPGQFWKDFVRETAPEFRKPTIEQLETFIFPVWEELVDGARYVDERLREIFGELEPDVIVEDNVVAFPAVQASGRPWVRIVSCNPLELKDPGLPPTFSGYPTRDRADWDEFRARYRELHEPLLSEFSAFCEERGAPPLRATEFIHESDWLNLYVYPAEVDYPRGAPLASTWHRLDTCVRRQETVLGLPSEIMEGAGGLVYVSLGSLGSADVDLMKRLVDVLSRAPHRFVVSKGPQASEFELAENMWGEEFLPQPALLPLADVVITHGGNNTTTECFHFGRPMVALPLFWDQYDNAQRVAEMGYGIRLQTYEFEDGELLDAIDRLYVDEALRGRMAAIAARVQASPGTARAADLIEHIR